MHIVCSFLFFFLKRKKKRNNICVTEQNEHKTKKKHSICLVCYLMKYNIISHMYLKKRAQKSNCSGCLIYESVLFHFKQNVYHLFLSLDVILFGFVVVIVVVNNYYIYFTFSRLSPRRPSAVYSFYPYRKKERSEKKND